MERGSNVVRVISGKPPLYTKPIINTSTTDPNGENAILGETDGTLKISNYGKSSGTLTSIGVEATTGEQRMVLMGHDGTALQRLKVEASRELGKTSAGTITPLLTGGNGLLLAYSQGTAQFVDPVLLTAGDAIILSLDDVTTNLYSVVMTLYNLTAGAVTATIYVDVAAGGSVGNAEYLMNAESIPAKTRVALPKVFIGGDDDIRGLAGAVDSINVHFAVHRVR